MWLTIVSFLTLFGGAGVPLGMPPAAEDVLMSRIAPDECVLYLSWAGMETPDPDSSNHTEQLLAEPEVQAMLAEIERQITAHMHRTAYREGDHDTKALYDDVEKWAKHLLRRPVAVFASRATMGRNGPDVQGGALIKVGPDIDELVATLLKYQSRFPPDAVESVTIDGASWHRITFDERAPKITWGVKGPYWLIGVGEGAIEDMLAGARTPAPDWLVDLRANLPVERVSSITYVNLGTLIDTVGPMFGPDLPRTLDALGLADVSSLASVTGLDAEGFVNRTLLGMDGEPEGLLAALTAESLTADDLEMIPADATVAMAASFDATALLDAVLEAAGKIDPRVQRDILEELEEIEAVRILPTPIGATREGPKLDIRKELLDPLGDRWCVYNSPSQGGLVLTGLTAVVKIDDHARLTAANDKLVALARAEFREDDEPSRYRRRVLPRIEQFDFNGQTIYMFNARDDEFPFCPSWCLTDSHLIVATFPQNIKAFLSVGDDFRSLAEVPEVASVFSSSQGPVTLTYLDTPKLFELIYPLVRMFAQSAFSELAREGIDMNVSILPSAPVIARHLQPSVGVVRRTEAGIEMVSRQTLPGGSIAAAAPASMALLLPAVLGARQSARRATSMNNLKQIGLAMHNYNASFGTFPPAYSTDDEGNPLLSWRVLILPFIGQQELFEQFKRDEPWDSPHNLKLADNVVEAYRATGSNAPPNKTNYLTVRGENTAFPGADKTTIAKMHDGSSNTIMVVEVADSSAVIWTKPDDFKYDPDDPIAGLVGLRRRGFNAGLCDGSVRFIAESIDPEALKALFTRDGREPVDWDEIDGQR